MLTLIWVDLTHLTCFYLPSPYPHSTEAVLSGLFVSCHLFQDGEETLEFEVKGHLALILYQTELFENLLLPSDTMEQSRHNKESSQCTSLRP